MKKSILFVDDERQILNSLKRVFIRTDYNLYFASSGEEALKILENSKINLIISDMRMPNMDGAKLLSIVKEKYPKVIRMILSGYSDETQALEVFENNLVISYILKPWDNEELIKTVEDVFKFDYVEINEELVQILNEVTKLPLSMRVYHELCNMIEEEKDIDDVSHLIEEDPTMALRILSIVNSAFYGLKTGSIKQAINYLGLNNLKSLILLSYLIDIDRCRFSKELNMLWQHLYTTNSIVIKIYHELLKEELPENIATIGLLHDIGKIIILAFYENKLESIIDFNDRIALDRDKERELFNNTHEEIGGYALSRLGMPHEMIECTLYHHDPLNDKVKNKKFTSVLHIADYCSWSTIYPEFHIDFIEECIDYLDVSKEEVFDFIKSYKSSKV